MPDAEPYDVAEVQFFNQEQPRGTLTQLAAVDALVIFCGAGLTIDHTGKGWSQLVLDVLTDRSRIPDLDINETEAKAVADVLDPLHLASVASHYLRENADDAQKMTESLHNTLRNHLYSLSDWSAGTLVDNVVRLALARALRQQAVTIVTTNYETTLEDRLRAQLASAPDGDDGPQPGLQVKVVGEDRSVGEISPRGDALTVTLIYLHGRIPRTGDINGRVAFSERDYLDSRQVVEETLVRTFSGSSILILGSSLTDPPLMNALLSTSEPHATCVRVALVPIQAISQRGSITLSRAQGNAVATHLPARMREFGVDLLMPDFFSQLAQFVEELRIRTVNARPNGDYAQRLESWWRAWQPHGARWKVQVDCHLALVDGVELIRSLLGHARGAAASDQETLKLEVWVRVPSGTRRRSLELWAASSGVVTDTSNPRWASLSLASRFSAVSSYQAGRPLFNHNDSSPTVTVRNPQEPRWRTFLSVPIVVSVGEGNLPVGVVTLASSLGHMSSRRHHESRIRANRPQTMRRVLTVMRDVGELVLTAPPTKPKRKRKSTKAG